MHQGDNYKQDNSQIWSALQSQGPQDPNQLKKKKSRLKESFLKPTALFSDLL